MNKMDKNLLIGYENARIEKQLEKYHTFNLISQYIQSEQLATSYCFSSLIPQCIGWTAGRTRRRNRIC